MSETLLRMGAIGKPHGIKGEIGVDWEGEYFPRPDDVIYLQDKGNKPSPRRIAGLRNHNGRLLLKLEGIDTRTQAEQFRGHEILISRDSLPPLEDDEAFLADLPGCKIYLRDGAILGRLDHIDFPANQPVWAIIDNNGQEILFPAQPDFIESIDLNSRKIIINPPPGLLEIYRA